MLFLFTQILIPTIKGLLSEPKVKLSSKMTSLLIDRPFSYVRVSALPHFLGYDFYPLITMPALSEDSSLLMFDGCFLNLGSS